MNHKKCLKKNKKQVVHQFGGIGKVCTVSQWSYNDLSTAGFEDIWK